MRTAFHRHDQFLRFRAYVRGLLEPIGRKNVESIAAAVRDGTGDSGHSQALQHFVSQSPWDARRLLAAVRAHTGHLRRDPDAVWVVHDGAFAKKGRHSVGVRRQLARSLGRKINCQVGVFLAQIGPRGYYPLAAQLYLPTTWLRECAGEVAKTVPAGEREPGTKAGLALRILDEVRSEESPLPLVAEAGYPDVAEFRDGFAGRGLTAAADDGGAVAETLSRFEWLKGNLGLDHYEGRTWNGWHHHVSLVFAAYGFLCGEATESEHPPFASQRQSESRR